MSRKNYPKSLVTRSPDERPRRTPEDRVRVLYPSAVARSAGGRHTVEHRGKILGESPIDLEGAWREAFENTKPPTRATPR